MAENQSKDSNAILETIASNPYKYGFKTDIESEEFEKGLNLGIVQKISQKKGEPPFLIKFRKRAFENWQKLKSPAWAHLNIPKIDYDNIRYYSIPKTKKKLGSLEDADPELLRTFEKLGVSLNEQKIGQK